MRIESGSKLIAVAYPSWLDSDRERFGYWSRQLGDVIKEVCGFNQHMADALAESDLWQVAEEGDPTEDGGRSVSCTHAGEVFNLTLSESEAIDIMGVFDPA